MAKISIMITSYNLQDYIDYSISSVVSQIFPCEWELLIGDDGSTDGTVNKIEKWINKFPQNIHLYKTTENKIHGLDGFRAAANRANLLEKATGDYLIFLDGDDCWLGNEKIKNQFEALEDINNNDCSCCAHNIYRYDVETNTGHDIVDHSIPSRKFSVDQYISHYYFHTNTILFRSECKEFLLDSRYWKYLNDSFITFCLLQKGKILYLNNTWAQYNITGTGLCTGSKKAYSCFRNIMLCDLEISMMPQLHRAILRTFAGFITYVLDTFDDNSPELESVQSLVKNVDEKVFKITTILANTNKKNCKNAFSRVRLRANLFVLRIEAFVKKHK